MKQLATILLASVAAQFTLAGCVVDGGPDWAALVHVSNECNVPVVVLLYSEDAQYLRDNEVRGREVILPGRVEEKGNMTAELSDPVYVWVVPETAQVLGEPHVVPRSQFTITNGTAAEDHVYDFAINGELCPSQG